MSVITIQIRGLTVTRRREGEVLSDPVSEIEDGDAGEAVVVAHFDFGRQYRDLPTESTFEVRVADSQDPLGLKEGDFGAVSVSTHLADSDEEEESSQRDRGPAERLRKRLNQRSDEGPRAWLQELARTAAQSEEPLELFLARAVAGGWLRARLKVDQDHLSLRGTLRPAKGRIRSAMAVRDRPLPGWVLDLDARLEADGALKEVRLRGAMDALPVPEPDLVKDLLVLRRRDPINAGQQLLQLTTRHPLAGIRLVGEHLLEMECFSLIEPEILEEEAPLLPSPSPSPSPEERPEAVFELLWSDDDKPAFYKDGACLDDTPEFERDKARVSWLAALLFSDLREEDAA